MYIDSRYLEDKEIIQGDICIIGAGAAGLSMALDWNGSKQKIILLEGGGFEYNDDIQDLYDGTTSGHKYYPLEATRMHMFGGTTAMWGGYCTPFDKIDFMERPWVPNSGWPIDYEDLSPFYKKATHLVELSSESFELEYWKKKNKSFKSIPFKKNFYDKMWQFSTPTKFGEKYKNDIVSSKNIFLYNYANVTEIRTNESLSKVSKVYIKNLQGKSHQVEAKVFILACGAIQNARVLLNSNKQISSGIGNEHDNVGRYFMEHIESRSAEMWFKDELPMDLYNYTWQKTEARAEIALTIEAQEKNEILNGTASFTPLLQSRNETHFIERYKSANPKKNKDHHHDLWKKFSRSFGIQIGSNNENMKRAYELYVRMEQAPRRNSRIYLMKDQDALGMHKVHLNWEFSDMVKRSIERYFRMLGQELGIIDMGRLKLFNYLINEDPNVWPDFFTPGNHQMGTTRMHEDPLRGVVDKNCKIHGLSNLFCAGSSCFPTGGAGNPTLTIIALSLRVSDHLKRHFKDLK